MIIGVPREIKEQENRVSLVPWGVSHLVKSGHCLLVERGAGVAITAIDRSFNRRGPCARSKGPKPDHSSHAQNYATWKRFRGHRRGPGRMCGNISSHHTRQPYFHGREYLTLLRRKHAGRLRSHGDAGIGECHIPVRFSSGK
jgi:Alanine dehydrogenase/PNT, N-terminal domain